MAILADEGRSALSMRRVASQMGVSLSNLQHYFPTLGDLLAASADHVLDESLARLHEQFGPALGAADLVALVDHLLDAHRDPQMAAVFVELWASASRPSGPGREAMRRFYDRYLALVADQLDDDDPGRALGIVLILEGSAVLAAGIAGEGSEAQWRAVRDVIVRLAT